MTNSVKNYLVAYNAVAFLFWLAFLVCFLREGLVLSPLGLWLLTIAQGLAVLEVVHTILKWVKSPVMSTLAQVFSRLLVLVLIHIFGPLAGTTPLLQAGIITVSLAWGITELVRYSFYALQLMGGLPRWLLWMRYSFFVVLYPVGVTGEWLIIAAPFFASGFVLNAYSLFVLLLLFSYVYYFPVLYKYMWKQRKARL